MNVAKKETKAKEAAAKKAAKIARDEKMRKQKAAAKAEHMQEITDKVLG